MSMIVSDIDIVSYSINCLRLDRLYSTHLLTEIALLKLPLLSLVVAYI